MITGLRLGPFIYMRWTIEDPFGESAGDLNVRYFF
jgi:hypothetical protein